MSTMTNKKVKTSPNSSIAQFSLMKPHTWIIISHTKCPWSRIKKKKLTISFKRSLGLIQISFFSISQTFLRHYKQQHKLCGNFKETKIRSILRCVIGWLGLVGRMVPIGRRALYCQQCIGSTGTFWNRSPAIPIGEQ